MTCLTLSQLSDLTGFNPRTVRKRLGALAPVEASSRQAGYRYDSADALRLLYDPAATTPANEKARLDRLRADRIEHDLAIQRQAHMTAAEVRHGWRVLSAEIRSHLLALPVKAAPLVIGARRIPEAREALENEVRAALESLAAGDSSYTSDLLDDHNHNQEKRS